MFISGFKQNQQNIIPYKPVKDPLHEKRSNRPVSQ